MDPEPQPQLTVDQSIEQVARLIDKANLHFGHGASDAQSEALWIVSKQLDVSPSDALEQLEQIIAPENH